MNILIETFGFQIGDRVCGKNTGLKQPSRIAGMIPAIYSPYFGKTMKRWDELYPTWKAELIVFCVFDEPVRSLTFEEYKSQLPDAKIYSLLKNNDEILRALYEHEFSLVSEASFPIRDIEYLETGE